MQLLAAWILGILLGVLPPEELDTARDGETVEEMEQRYADISQDLAEVVIQQRPLFKGKRAHLKTTALLISVARFESTLRRDIDTGEKRGDGGRSWCLMQINVGKKTVRLGPQEMRTWHGPDLVKDRRKCFRAGLEHLRASMWQCRQYKNDGAALISGYIWGPRCIPEEERSAKRWALYTKILKRYPAPPDDLVKSALAMGG